MQGDKVGVVQYDAIINTDTLASSGKKAESMAAGVGDTIEKRGSKSFQNFSKEASGAFNSVADTIASVAVKVAAFAIGGSLGLGTFVKSASELQSTSQSFKVLIGNVDTANALFGQLAKYANSTPFEFPQIAQAGRTLLGFGIQSDQVYGRIQQLGDIAAATGADFQSLALVYGQVNAAGRLYGQDALQLINNSVPIYNILSKQMGISVKDVRDQMEKGAITADIFNKALQGTTEQGGFAFQGVNVLAQSFQGRLSTLKDTVLEFGRNLIGVKVDPKLGLVVEPGGIFDRLSILLPRIGDSLQELTPRIKGFMDFILRNGDSVKAAIGAIAVAFVAAKVAAIAFAIVASPISYQFLAIAAGITAAVAVLAFLQLRFDIFGKAVRGIITAVQWLGALFSSVFSAASNWIKSVAASAVHLYQNVFSAVSTAIDAIGIAFTAVKNVAMGVFNAITGWLYDWRYWIQNISIVIGTLLLPKLTQIGIEAAKAAYASIVSFTRMAASTSASFATTAYSATINAAKTSAAWVIAAAKSSYAWVTQTLPQMIIAFTKASVAAVAAAVRSSAAWVAGSVRTLIAWGLTFAAYLWGVGAAVAATVAAGISMAAAWLMALGPIGLIIAVVIGLAALVIANWDTVKGWFMAFWNWLSSAASNAWNAVKNAFSAAGSFFANLWNNITSTFKNIGSAVGDAIGNAFKGAINGILGFVERTVNGIIDTINGAIGAIDKVTPGGLPRVGKISIPRLADGGIAMPTPGGIIANLAEAGQPEAIIPLDKLDDIIGDAGGRGGVTIELNMSGVMTSSRADLRTVAKDMINAVNEELRAKGHEEIGGGKLRSAI